MSASTSLLCQQPILGFEDSMSSAVVVACTVARYASGRLIKMCSVAAEQNTGAGPDNRIELRIGTNLGDVIGETT